MRFISIMMILSVFLLASCTSDVDLYQQTTLPQVQNYVDLIKEFNKVYATGLPADISLTDITALDSMAATLIAIENNISQAPLPVKLSGGDQYTALKEQRNQFLNSTNEMKGILDLIKDIVTLDARLKADYKGLKEYLDELKGGPRLNNEKSAEAYLQYQGYKLEMEMFAEKLTTKMEKAKRKMTNAVQEVRYFSKGTQASYGLEFPGLVSINFEPLLQAHKMWQAEYLVPVQLITDEKTFADKFRNLELK